MNTKVEQLFQTFVENANKEDFETLETILNGLVQKQQGNYHTYLAAITNSNATPLENGSFQMTAPIQPLIENPLRIVHGGMTALLLDSTMGSMLAYKLPKDQAAVTVEMKVNYIKPGTGKELICISSVVHIGKQLCMAEGKVYNDKGTLIATGTGTFFIISRK
ncbi:PaaI family thioesterase [Bacillus alkalicellulosilyticus]|uniref:PaaI family thioesterase n=1 Tax=Alkalihalobacterium alkalicellulosilyticum TaxID=1912214 RepID=UPI00099737DC|nr:PaaI family thioesterase [Bacillus alkalicellulosilyticus]